MARYIQRISLLGKERWIGWEIDGVGTEVPGLTLADDMTEDELRARGIRDFKPMPFESFLGMGSAVSGEKRDAPLLDEDVAFRLDALQVGMERFRSRGVSDVPRAALTAFFADVQLDDPRVQERLRSWATSGAIELVGADDCYFRIRGRLA